MKNKRQKGFIYVLTNPCFRDGWIKVGKTLSKREPDAETLCDDGVPVPYGCAFRTGKISGVDEYFEIFCEELGERFGNDFFNVSVTDATALLKKIVAEPLPEKTPQKKGVFAELGIAPGEKIFFVKDEDLVAVVEDNRRVSFDGKIYTTSALAQELLNVNAARGPLYFKYNGKTLAELQEERKKSEHHHRDAKKNHGRRD